MSYDQFGNIVLETVPRILSSVDRNPLSSTYGCFDKAYWCYKTSDFPCARYQEASFILALLYLNKFKNNIYYSKKEIKDLAIAGLDYWTSIQNKDGSFDEWYPNERSFVATAFSTYKCTEVFLLLKNHINNKKKYLNAFEKAANWLMKNSEEVSNQSIGTLLAVYNVFMISQLKKYKLYCNNKTFQLIKLQSKEGWFDEYGGADFGYLSLTIDYLAIYFHKTKDPHIKKIINNILDFYIYFVHPDGSVGGCYASRNTEFKFPYGFSLMAQNDERAAYIIDTISKNIYNTTNPLFMDDRFALQYLDSFLLAALTPKSKKVGKAKKDYMKLFEQSGLFIKSNNYLLISNLKKGGVFRLFGGNKNITNDCGFFGKYKGKIITSQWLGASDYKIDGNRIIIKGKFKKISSIKRLNPLYNILLRSFLITFGRLGFFSRLFKKKMRNKLILKVKNFPLEYKREIILSKHSIKIKDIIINPKNLKLDCLYLTKDAKSIYVPTSNFFSGSLEKDNFIKIKPFDYETKLEREYIC